MLTRDNDLFARSHRKRSRFVTRLCDNPYVWRDVFIYVTWLIHTCVACCNSSHSYMWHDSFADTHTGREVGSWQNYALRARQPKLCSLNILWTPIYTFPSGFCSPVISTPQQAPLPPTTSWHAPAWWHVKARCACPCACARAHACDRGTLPACATQQPPYLNNALSPLSPPLIPTRDAVVASWCATSSPFPFVSVSLSPLPLAAEAIHPANLLLHASVRVCVRECVYVCVYVCVCVCVWERERESECVCACGYVWVCDTTRTASRLCWCAVCLYDVCLYNICLHDFMGLSTVVLYDIYSYDFMGLSTKFLFDVYLCDLMGL